MSKESLRVELKQKRQQLTPEEVAAKSRLIINKAVAAFWWDEVKSVHCFSSMTEANEVDTSSFLSFLMGRPEIQTYTSRKIDGVWQQGRLEAGRFQPVEELPTLDHIYVPMLGFDSRRHRIGYGGGWYDRFLAEQPEAIKIGFCFELGRVPEVPAGPLDIMLDRIITEA